MKARIYTKTGDKGQTSLVGGTRVPKTHARLEAYGTMDELNSVLGMLRAELSTTEMPAEFAAQVETRLQSLQNSLFNIGSHLACEDEGMRGHLPGLHPDRISALETDMDIWETDLPPLKNFILPGGSRLAAYAHIARTVCRRVERLCVGLPAPISVDTQHLIFLNRLSDWLFLLAREFNSRLRIADIEWSKD